MFDRTVEPDPRQAAPPSRNRYRMRDGHRREYAASRDRGSTSFPERCARGLADIGVYGAVSYRDLAEARFGGHPYTTRRAVNAWVREGLVTETRATGPGGNPFKVLTLTRSAAGFAGPEIEGKAEAESEPLTLETLFDIYGEEVTPTKGEQSRHHDRAAMKMFLGCFGRDRKPATLSQRDWDRFIRKRRAGRVGPSGKPVSDRMIERDLKFLIAVLNWAAKSRDEQGRLLLEANPLRGLKTPKQKNPARIVLAEEEYQALLQVSRQVDWRFRVALVLAHETGHRIGAIRQLRWSDIDMEGKTIRWRAEHEKSGYEHRTPVTAEALAALEEARKRNPVTGHTLVLPSPQDPSRCVGSCQARGWWQKAEGLAGLEPKRGRGWHSLRRKFASDLMDQPLKVLCELGGWKEAKTVLQCYQRADEAQLRKALESRRRVRA